MMQLCKLFQTVLSNWLVCAYRSGSGSIDSGEDDSRLQELQRQHADREQALLAKVG